MLSIKGQRVNKQVESRLTSKQFPPSSSKTLQKPPLPKQKKKVKKFLKHDYVCDQRRENHLTAKFIRKKQELFEITRENVRLFQKINSQKSIYSHESLNKAYESNRSLMGSRMSSRSNRSINKSLNKSKVSNCSQKSQRSNISHKSNDNNKFFNRATSAKSMTQTSKPAKKSIIIRDLKHKSMLSLNPKSIKQSQTRDIEQFAGLFNIKQQPRGKQRHRPMRVQSTKILRPLRVNNCGRGDSAKCVSSANKGLCSSQSKQIVINEQNQIEIHEEIEVEQEPTFRKQSQRQRCNTVVIVKSRQQANQQSHKKQPLEQSPCINILVPQFPTQPLKTQSRSSYSNLSTSHRTHNIQNLFQLKNSCLKSRLSKRLGDQKITSKYTNLLSKINMQLNKANKRNVKETTIFPFRSRLIV